MHDLLIKPVLDDQWFQFIRFIKMYNINTMHFFFNKADRLVNVAGNLSVFVDEELPVNVLTDGDSKTCYNVSSDKPLKVDLGEPHRIVAIQVEGQIFCHRFTSTIHILVSETSGLLLLA